MEPDLHPLAFHLTFRALDSRVLAPDVRAQRVVTDILHGAGEDFGVLAFRAAGDHLHVTAACDRAEAGRLSQVAGSALTQRLGLPGFAPAHLEPCFDQRHVEEAFFYVLRNAEKHGVTNDPLHEASSIGALLGMRIVAGSFLGRVRRMFPSLERGALLAVLGVRELEPAFQLDQLADAAAGAVGLAALDESVVGKRARAAALRVALRVVSVAAAAGALGVSERSARRYRGEREDPLLERAIGLRLGLRAALGDRARVDTPVPVRPVWRPGRRGLEAARREADHRG